MARIAIVGSLRYSINANDFYMFFSRSGHELAGVFLQASVAKLPWFKKQAKVDRARSNSYLPYADGVVQWWSTDVELCDKLDAVRPDYICIGNGSDATGQLLRARYRGERLIFSEYGWFPWKECFYMSRHGAAMESEIGRFSSEEIQDMRFQPDEIKTAVEAVRSTQRSAGEVSVEGRDFIYVPLQVDIGDFKFGLTHFKTNGEFLNFIQCLVPSSVEIWVRNHPLNKRPVDLRNWPRFRDISCIDYRKEEIYSRMAAMIVINSTSALEALAYERPVFVYGRDIYTGKGICWEGVEDRREFEEKTVRGAPNFDLASRFLALLFRYQVNRIDCLSKGDSYVRDHFWNKCL